MGKHKLVTKTPVNDYVTVHPALDFWDGKAIVAIGGKWLNEYEGGDLEFTTKPLCVMSNGEKFEYSKKELSARCLFHTGYLEIPSCRWDFADIDEFGQDPSSMLMSQLYKEIRTTIDFYMEFLDPRLYSLFTCFIIYTYFHPIFNGAPIIQLWGEFRTGKTKLCSLLEAMCFNPVNSANISSASVFRLVESRRSTVLLDESEDLTGSEKGAEIRNMLLAGTGKSGETYRQEKMMDDTFATKSFKVFSPKVIANITGISIPALQSRTIRVTTIGAADRLKENREVVQEDAVWQPIRNQLYRACLTRHEEVIESRWHLPEHNLSGRNLSIWQGIMSIANLCGEEVWKDILSYAIENKEYIDADAEEGAEKPRAVLRALLDLFESYHPEPCQIGDGIVKLTPDELATGLSRTINFTSKREMGLIMGRLGFHSRVGNDARYYELDKAKIQALAKRR